MVAAKAGAEERAETVGPAGEGRFLLNPDPVWRWRSGASGTVGGGPIAGVMGGSIGGADAGVTGGSIVESEAGGGGGGRGRGASGVSSRSFL